MCLVVSLSRTEALQRGFYRWSLRLSVVLASGGPNRGLFGVSYANGSLGWADPSAPVGRWFGRPGRDASLYVAWPLHVLARSVRLHGRSVALACTWSFAAGGGCDPAS